MAGRDINLHARQTLATVPVTEEELVAVRRAWVKVDRQGNPLTTASSVLALLQQGEPVIVISGARGMGKTASALRALSDYNSYRAARDVDGSGRALELEHVLPDWGEEPDADTLPLAAHRGYVLDVSEEADQWHDVAGTAKQILSHGGNLRKKASCLIVITSESGWPSSHSVSLGRIAVTATARPRGDLIARSHLTRLYPETADRWLGTGQDDEEADVLSDFVHPDTYPRDAADIAQKLGSIGDSPDAVNLARSALLQWRDVVKKVFADTREKADDRALLLAAIMLEGDTPANILAAARQLLKDQKTRGIRDILTGPDLATRLEDVQAEVNGQSATFSHRPGYPGAVLRYVWRQLSDVQGPLLEWIKDLTRPNGLGADHLGEISNLLVRLAVDENDLSVLDVARSWAASAQGQGRQAAASMLAQAADDASLGTATRTRLRAWAGHDAVNTSTVAAVVCQGDFAKTYPRQALTCLRWILDRPKRDEAVTAAEDALRAMADDVARLPEVWTAVMSWADKKSPLAARRAFLTLLDPDAAPETARRLLNNALAHPQTADELVAGWCEALSDPLLEEECERLLEAWAQAVADGVIGAETVVPILDRVVDGHMMAGPMAAFLIGKAGATYNSSAVISMREMIMVRRRTSPGVSSGNEVGTG
ncbi:hypothetical protein AB0G83_06095 [Streptomyces klenkii]|uniref:hypothetical protein n=1 Tax=Streptomyces klenkii TaxID=1420899 RepID=UPI0033CE3BB6